MEKKLLISDEARKWRSIKYIAYAVVLVVLSVLPLIMSSHLQLVMTKFIIMAMFAVSYDLIFGYLGLASLGHAAFFGMGCYVVGVMALHFGSSNFWVALVIGLLLAGVTAALFGFISLRFTGVYFLLITFALGQILYAVSWNVAWLNTPGMQGISGITWPNLGIPLEWNRLGLYYLALIMFIVVYFVITLIVDSPFGHALVGIRESEGKMKALGYNTYSFKFIAYVISGAFAGVAGVLFAFYSNMVTPSDFTLDYSFLPMAAAIIGSRSTLYGPVVGAAILVFAEYFISNVLPDRWPLILGILFVAAIMLLRKGVVTSIVDAIKAKTARKKVK